MVEQKMRIEALKLLAAGSKAYRGESVAMAEELLAWRAAYQNRVLDQEAVVPSGVRVLMAEHEVSWTSERTPQGVKVDIFVLSRISGSSMTVHSTI